MHYRIIRTENYIAAPAESIKELEQKVNNSIRAGFEPIGGVCADGDAEGTFFYQAVIDRQKVEVDDEDS